MKDHEIFLLIVFGFTLAGGYVALLITVLTHNHKDKKK